MTNCSLPVIVKDLKPFVSSNCHKSLNMVTSPKQPMDLGWQTLLASKPLYSQEDQLTRCKDHDYTCISLSTEERTISRPLHTTNVCSVISLWKYPRNVWCVWVYELNSSPGNNYKTRKHVQLPQCLHSSSACTAFASGRKLRSFDRIRSKPSCLINDCCDFIFFDKLQKVDRLVFSNRKT